MFGIDPWSRARIADLGDVPLPRANDNEDCIRRITDFYADIDAAGGLRINHTESPGCQYVDAILAHIAVMQQNLSGFRRDSGTD